MLHELYIYLAQYTPFEGEAQVVCGQHCLPQPDWRLGTSSEAQQTHVSGDESLSIDSRWHRVCREQPDQRIKTSRFGTRITRGEMDEAKKKTFISRAAERKCVECRRF